MGIYRL